MFNIKKLLAMYLLLMFAAFGSVSYADESVSKEPTIENAFSQCGIGAAIFKNNETAAIISNIIWDLGTTALSSQISSPSSCEGANTTAAIFINETYHALEGEIVKGEGEYLTALLDIVGCSSGSQSKVTADLQASFRDALQAGAMKSASDQEKLAMVGRMVDISVSGVCAA